MVKKQEYIFPLQYNNTQPMSSTEQICNVLLVLVHKIEQGTVVVLITLQGIAEYCELKITTIQ